MSSKKENSIKAFFARFWGMIQGDNTAKLFFLLLSVFLWLLINLSKEGFTSSVDFPVSYDQAPDGYRLVNEPPSNLRVDLEGRGFDIIKCKLKSLDPLSIPLREARLNDTNAYVLNTAEQEALIGAELGDNISVTRVSPGEIGLKFSPIKQKKFKVHLKYKKNFSKFKSLYRTPIIKPDSITVWGTENELAEIDSIDTELLRLDADEDSLSIIAKLDLPERNNLEFSHDEVKVDLVFTSLTEGTLEVPIRMKNTPPGYRVTLIPKKVSITYQVAINDFAKIEAEDFECYADLRDLERNPEFLTLKVKTVPDLVRNYSLSPVRVEYILTK